MALWGVVLFVALAGITVSADPSLTFPEIARGPSRIVSGWEAEEGQLPFQLSMRMVNAVGTVNACGGSIIHKEWGMTAAHCTAQRVTMVLRAGAVNLTRPEILFETTEYYNHPLYNAGLPSVVQPNDLAVLKFPIPLKWSPRVQPLRLQRSADMNKNYDGMQLVASGWGLTWSGGSSPENLNWVFLRGDSNLRCWQMYGGSNIIVDSTICASGYNVTSQSTCQGDSGGPMTVVDVDEIVTAVGVASFVSSTGCHTDFPAGFIRPGHYHDWYRNVTGINFDWDPESITEPPTTTEGPTVTEETTTNTPEPSVTTPEPEPPITTPEPEPPITTPESTEPELTTTNTPETSVTTPEPEPPITTPKPEPPLTTPESTEPELTTTNTPETSVTTPEPEPPITTPKPEPPITTPESTEPELTTTNTPEPSVTTPEPEPPVTTPAPEPPITTPESTEPEVTTTNTPETSVTTPEPEPPGTTPREPDVETTVDDIPPFTIVQNEDEQVQQEGFFSRILHFW